ncbi:MAG: hypothetical protein ACFFD2_07875 [Promethearchaeota archaeon]
MVTARWNRSANQLTRHLLTVHYLFYLFPQALAYLPENLKRFEISTAETQGVTREVRERGTARDRQYNARSS